MKVNKNINQKILCIGEWGCWTDWSPCSVSCGVGKRTRTRQCLAMNNDLYGTNCEGSSVEYDTCEQPSCDCEHFVNKLSEITLLIFPYISAAFLGWSSWSEWTECNEDEEKVRYRKCLTTDPDTRECQGNEKETRNCVHAMANGKPTITHHIHRSIELTKKIVFLQKSSRELVSATCPFSSSFSSLYYWPVRTSSFTCI